MIETKLTAAEALHPRAEATQPSGERMLHRLHQAGYIVIHLDDIEQKWPTSPENIGWQNCRAAVIRKGTP